MRSKSYLIVLSLILFSSLILFGYLLLGNKISAQQGNKTPVQQDDAPPLTREQLIALFTKILDQETPYDDSPLTEEDLIARFTKILDHEIPLLKFKVDNDGAGEIKFFFINAARTFIGGNNFSGDQKLEADKQILEFVTRLKKNSEDSGTAKVNEKDLIAAPAPVENNTNQNRTNTDDGNVSTPAGNINQPTVPPQNINQEVNANTNINMNRDFRQSASKSRVAVSPNFGYSFAPMPDNRETLDFDRKKISKKVVEKVSFGLCPIIPICR